MRVFFCCCCCCLSFLKSPSSGDLNHLWLLFCPFFWVSFAALFGYSSAHNVRKRKREVGWNIYKWYSLNGRGWGGEGASLCAHITSMTVEAAFYDRDMRLTGLVSHSSTFDKVLFLDVYVYMYIVVVSAQSLRMCCAFKSRNTLSESDCHHSISLSSFSWFYHALLFSVSGPELLYLTQIAQKQAQQLTVLTKLSCFSTFPFVASFFLRAFFYYCAAQGFSLEK